MAIRFRRTSSYLPRTTRPGRRGQPAQSIPVRLSDLLRDGDMSQDIAMQPGDTLVIPQGWF